MGRADHRPPSVGDRFDRACGDTSDGLNAVADVDQARSTVNAPSVASTGCGVGRTLPTSTTGLPAEGASGQAKRQCDYLIVGLQMDPTLDRPEKNAPTQTVVERYIQLRGCQHVDENVPYSTEQDLEDVLRSDRRFTRAGEPCFAGSRQFGGPRQVSDGRYSVCSES